MPLLITLALLLVAPGSLRAQGLPRVPGPVVTDRPDKTESTSIVPRGHAQLETGWALETADAGGVSLHTHSVPGILARVGLAARLEARAGFPGFLLTNQAVPGAPEGLADLELGFKYRMAVARRWLPDVAVIGAVSVPTGAEGVSSNRVDPSVLITMSRPLGERVSVGSNVGTAWTTVDDGQGGRATLVDLTYTLSFGIALSDRVGTFAETFGSLPTNGGQAAHHLDGGLTFLLRDNLQLDASLGRGIGGAGSSDWFFGAGFSVRLPR